MSWFIRMEKVIQPDGPIRWSERLRSEIADHMKRLDRPVVVDAGCGVQGHVPVKLGPGRGVRIGIDIDPDGAQNPDIDYFVRASADRLPLRSGCADVLVSSFVLEHLRDPDTALREFGRVLKSDGRAFLWTSNSLNYAMIVAALTPTSFHNWMRRLSHPELEKENMPTPYRVNRPGLLVRALERAGLKLDGELQFGAGAYLYFCFSRVLFVMAAVASRVARKTPLRRMQACMIARCVKTASAPGPP